ncbi:MAG: pentapeptide repeat-containing protein [Kofleriaceae bacterium]|nr:pentapeptide repeat-containing protein [Kofleriaceae bacterium]
MAAIDRGTVAAMDLPGAPRSTAEVRFFAEEAPCERCGGTGWSKGDPGMGAGWYRGQCAHCGAARELRFEPVTFEAEPFTLGPPGTTSRVLDAGRLRAIADRELRLVPADPGELATVVAFNEARRHLVRGRTALNELASHRPDDAGVAAEARAAAELWERFKAAKADIEATPGAQPIATTLEGRVRQHAAWLRRDRRGDGRLELRGEVLHGAGHGLATAMLDHAVIADCTFTRVDLSYAHLHHAVLARARFLDCRLSFCELDEAELDDCDLAGSRLSLSDLRGTRLRGGDWRGVAAGRSTWRAQVTGLDLRDASLRDAVLDGSVFERCDLRGADLGRVELTLVALGTARRTRFVECDLRGLRLDGLRLDGTVFERCRMHGLVGRPVLEGEVAIIDPDLSADGAGIPEPEAGARLLASWQGGG